MQYSTLCSKERERDRALRKGDGDKSSDSAYTGDVYASRNIRFVLENFKVLRFRILPVLCFVASICLFRFVFHSHLDESCCEHALLEPFWRPFLPTRPWRGGVRYPHQRRLPKH